MPPKEDSKSLKPEVGVAVTKSSNWLTASVGTVTAEQKSVSMKLPVITDTGRDTSRGSGAGGGPGQPATRFTITGLTTFTVELQTGPGPGRGEQEDRARLQDMVTSHRCRHHEEQD